MGGDGALFGKGYSACAWLVSFFNIGHGVLSSNENFLLFGANCSENCAAAAKCIRHLVVYTVAIERIGASAYFVLCKREPVKVKFVVSELHNDMKMLAFLGGELSNSAKYFSTFADVSTENANNINGTFGLEESIHGSLGNIETESGYSS